MDLSDLLKKIIEVFEGLEIPYLVTGSVASMAYGEPRLTNDIDIVAGIEDKHIPHLIAEFPADEFYLSEDMVRDAVRRHGQFNIIHPASGLKVDVMLRKNTPFDDSRFNRIRRIRPSELYLANFAAPEDVIIKKMECYHEGGSEKHLRDIAGILKISDKEIDRNYISDWAKQLGLIGIWKAVQKRVDEKQ